MINIVFAISWFKLKNKYTEGYGERKGIQSPEKLAILGGKRPLWIHSVSVGEVQAAVPLIKEARISGYSGPVILSTTTETGKAMAFKLGAGLFDLHIYYPWDKRAFVCAALDTLRPWAFITAETELWPNMLWELEARGIPAFLINGRISDRTWARLNRKIMRGAGAELYGLFTEIFVRDKQDAERLNLTGINESKIRVCGDSKIDALTARREAADVEFWADKLNARWNPVFIAGSTHTGEDEIVIEAFAMLKKSVPKAKLIIAPRHPERASSVAALAADKFRTCLMSEPDKAWDIMVVDRIGALFELYGIANAAFVGGSFVDRGGQNILEPALWGVPVQYGPHMEDFAEVSKDFIRLGIADQIENAEKLAEIWIDIAAETDKKERCKAACKRYFAERTGAAHETWADISRYAYDTYSNEKDRNKLK